MMRWILLSFLALCLAACKTELYSDLDEAQANQMMALLLYNGIDVEKMAKKEGITLRVEKDRFVNAIEMLRQNGLPRRKNVDMKDLFPSGQLVTSPEQEAAKLIYLKSQQLEKMLANMDGVIVADVVISAPHIQADDNTTPVTPSASVFVKYSPDSMMPARIVEIRNLVQDSIPGLSAEHVSIVLQRAEYRYLKESAKPAPDQPWSSKVMWSVAAIVMFLMGCLVIWIFFARARSRKLT